MRSPEALAAALVDGAAGPLERAKRIHDWIAQTLTYDAAAYFSGKRGDNSWAGVLKSRKAVCAGYSELFMRLCACST